MTGLSCGKGGEGYAIVVDIVMGWVLLVLKVSAYVLLL